MTILNRRVMLQKLYRTLSEIKSEVEAIIKTGRKMVEEQAVSEPEDFSGQIDSLKELYNKLGAQVTDSKGRLEGALLTARELQSDLLALGAWLDALGRVGPQTLELEMSRMEAVRDKLNANYADYANGCDPVYLEDVKRQVDAINARWDHLKKHGLVKHSRGNDADALQKYLNEIENELECPETMSAPKLKVLSDEVRAQASEVHALDSNALTKQWENLLEKITVSAFWYYWGANF